MNNIKIFAFADEASPNIDEQITALKRNSLSGRERRNVDGVNISDITLEKAKELALKHANLDESNTTLVKAREEIDNGIAIYEIEYKDNTYEYDFDISKSGEILNYDKDRLYD